MNQTYGNYVESNNNDREYLKIGFSPTSIPLQQRWRNNGLSADFLADYLSTFFPGQDDEALEKQAEIKDAVSYIANELLENAMKFSYSPAQHAVSITLELDKEALRFYVSNCVDPKGLPKFQKFIHQILTEDPHELYLAQLMSNEADEAASTSSLGFLTMINDYQAELAWKFETVKHAHLDEDVILITTLVKLPI